MLVITSPRKAALALALALLAVGGDAGAAPPTKQRCADAYAETQTHRKANELRAAREQAVVCAQATCPRFIREPCTNWLDEIERAMPTVVFGARSATGQDLAEVRVTMDGQELATKLTGESMPVEPGEHAFRFEHGDAVPVESKVIVRVGEKNRRIDVTFAAPAPPPPPPPPAPPPEAPSRTMPAVIGLGAVAVAGLGVFATMASLGLSEKNNLDKTCAPNCSPAQANGVKTKLVAGDVGLFTAIAAAIAGTTVFLVGRQKPAPAAALSFDVTAGPRAGFVSARGSF